MTLTGPGAPVTFQVAVNATGEFECRTAGDQPIPHLRPAIVATLDGIAQVVQRLVQLAKYRNVQALDVPDPSAPGELQVSPELVGGVGRRRDAPGCCALAIVVLTIKNLLTPNPADPNDPSRVPNVTVLGLNADWRIEQAYPAEARNIRAAGPGWVDHAALPCGIECGLHGRNDHF